MAKSAIRDLPHQAKFVAVNQDMPGSPNNAEKMGLGPEIMDPPECWWGEGLVGGGSLSNLC